MKIGSIQSNSFLNLVNINQQEKKEAKTHIAKDKIVTVPLDNYARYLVNFKSGKTEAMKKAAELPFDFKLSYAINELISKDLLIIGKNLVKAKKIIKENIDKRYSY